MIPIYYGADPREEIGWHTFCSSVVKRASWPVSLIPLHLPLFRSFWGFDQRTDETTQFSRTRFLIPFLQDFRGWAIFCDGSDMIVREDIAQLWALRDEYADVLVAPHDYRTKHPRKFVGTDLEADNRDYPRKNWSSVMLINCAAYGWRQMTPERVGEMTGEELHQFQFLHRVKHLPLEWNWLVDEYGQNMNAKLLHYTAGIPAFPHYTHAPMADEWAQEAARITHATR